MRGRPKIFDKEEVIDKATGVFWSNGYEASSADQLLSAMGIGKGSFYLAFKGGKRELYEKTLERFSQQAMQNFRDKISKSEDPVEVIREFFRSIADSPSQSHDKGCYFGNAIMEMSTVDKILKEKAVKLLKQLEVLFEETIAESQRKGTIQTTEKPALVAKYLINLWNGLNITRRMYPEKKHIKPLIEMNLKILQ